MFINFIIKLYYETRHRKVKEYHDARRVRLNISEYSYNYDTCYITYKGKKILQFESPIDFSTFWEFWVGIYFYEFEIHGVNQIRLRDTFIEERNSRTNFNDYLHSDYLDYLFKLEEVSNYNLSELMGDCISISCDDKYYKDTLQNKKFKKIIKRYLKFIKNDENCFINKICKYQEYIFGNI